MDHDARRVREGAGYGHPRESAARPEIHPHPRLWRQRQELKRIGNVPGPQLREASMVQRG